MFLYSLSLKGNGNEADFPRFLHKSVRHWSLALHSDFGFEFAEIFENRKTTHRLGDSLTLRLGKCNMLTIFLYI